MLQDTGNIELMTFKEQYTESRNFSIANDEERLQVQEKVYFRYIPTKAILWKIFKFIVFLICIIFVVIQSVEFYEIYSEYPTNMVQKSTILKKVKLPAVTLCFKNTVSTEKFCNDNPEFCGRPNNLEGFCRIYPNHCQGNTSNLMIPKGGYTRIIYETTVKYLINDTFNDDHLYYRRGQFSLTRTFVKAGGFFYKCYSRNLHLYQSGSKPDTEEIDFNGFALIENFVLKLSRIELFDMTGNPQVFLGIHSPFIPINPVLEGHPIRTGHLYIAEVKLMCLEMCESEFSKANYNCDDRSTMISPVNDLCFELKVIQLSPERESQLWEKRNSCLQNCRPGCLKLDYKYKIEEREYDPYQMRAFFGLTKVQINMRNKKVTLRLHFPQYGSGEMFSHIGGLLGYWLGISVLTFLVIIEKCFVKVTDWMRRFKEDTRQETANSENLV
ncbi:unnamed protein product [Larinioides sclopetarius]|uniref:Uncharacterized protein n=1 Tax=Larinioides sclopetarius TaxID=280406 RepID=A0AAV1ZUF1_9ARAC